MNETTRTNTRDADPDAWASIPAPPKVDPDLRLAKQRLAEEMISRAVFDVTSGLNDMDRYLAPAMDALTDTLNYQALAETVAWLQDARRRLGEAESYVARELGRMDGCPDVVELSDGRRAEVMKGKDRKAWKHDDWKRDVRAAVVRDEGLEDTDVVNAETGEEVALWAMLEQVQNVHGSTAPKVTALKALGLSADNYCETFPGPYNVKISAPATTTPEG